MDAQNLNTQPPKPEESLQLFPPKDCAPSEQHLDHKHRTTGNKIYDWGIYTTFAWAGVAAVSALSAHEAMHGKNPAFNWLRSLNDNCISGLSKALSNTIMKGKPPENIRGWAKGSTMFVTLGLGGWAMMAPIKWLEDNREKNAARIDNFLGTTPPDPRLVEAEVPQTWSSVLSGRLMSWGLSYAAFAAMGPKTTGHVSDWFADKATKGFMHLRPQANIAKVKKWADIAAFDATFTVITAAATYAFSRMFARRNARHSQEESALMTFDPATPTPLAPVMNHDHEPETKRFTDSVQPKTRSLAPKTESFTEKAINNKEMATSAPQLG